MSQKPWRCEPEWPGETAFIVCSGPSRIGLDLGVLKGRRVIACNSSCFDAPFADFVIFADSRWWEKHRTDVEAKCTGRIIACSTAVFGDNPRVKMMWRQRPPGLAEEPSRLAIKATVATAAINLAVHLGAKRIVNIALDGKNAPDGRSHAHAPHPWRSMDQAFRMHRADLASLVEPLKAKGVECLLATPGSAYQDLWPTVPLENLLSSFAECAA